MQVGQNQFWAWNDSPEINPKMEKYGEDIIQVLHFLFLRIFSSSHVSCIMRVVQFRLVTILCPFYKYEEFEAYLLILRSSSSFPILFIKPSADSA
jgi:hypothetical protein